MNEKSPITLMELVILLRQHVLTAQQEGNIEQVTELQIVLDILSDLTAQAGDVKTASLLVDMADTTRDLWMGATWKSEMPSAEDIKKVFIGT